MGYDQNSSQTSDQRYCARLVAGARREDDRVWVLLDWDEEGFQNFLSDPEVKPIVQEAGHKGRPQVAELGGRYDA